MARYETVKNRSELQLNARSSVHPIHTVVDKVDGFFEAEFDGEGQLTLAVEPRGHLEVKVDSLKSGNALIDRAMQGRLNTRRYPSLKAEVVQIVETDKKGFYRATGDVSFHGVKRRLKDELFIKQLDERTIEIHGVTEVDTRDFRVEPPKMFMLKVEPQVRVTLRLVLERVDQ